MDLVLALLAAVAGPSEEAAAVRDLWRFPPPAVAAEARAAAQRHQKYAERVAVANADVPEFGWDLYPQRAVLIYRCWDALDDCYHPCWDADGVVPLAERLGVLRRLIGVENYRGGLMPLVPGP